MKKHSQTIAILHLKPQSKSYINRHKEKSELKNKQEIKLSNSVRNGWKEDEISERRDKIIDALQREKEVSRMRIEDESM